MAVNIHSLSYKGKIFFRDCQNLNQIFFKKGCLASDI